MDDTRIDVTVLNTDGSRTETITDTSANGTLLDKSVITTSANGLSKTTQDDAAGAGVFNLTETDVTLLNADGSSTETVTDTNANRSLRRKTVATKSSDGKNVAQSRDIKGDGVVDQTSTAVMDAD